MVLLALLATVWQIVAIHNRFLIPRLGQIWSDLSHHPGQFLRASGVTLQETGVGLGASIVVAFVLALAMSHVRLVEHAVMPLAVILNVTPVVSLAPGLAVAFGFGLTPRYLVTGIIAFFPLLINSLAGLRSVDHEALDYFRSLNARRRDLLVHLRVPSSLPYLFAAARICFPLGLIGAVVAEFSAAGNRNGLGSLIELATQETYLPQVYAAIVCLALLGLAFTFVVVALERRLLSWDRGRRPGS